MATQVAIRGLYLFADATMTALGRLETGTVYLLWMHFQLPATRIDMARQLSAPA